MVDTTEQEEIIHWNEPRHGNKYLQKIDPKMLLPDGYLIRKEIRPIDHGKGSKKWVQIRYDRSYIIAKIHQEILEPLNLADYNSFQKLVSEAWKLCQKI
jgi:hypothetical protein